MTQGELLFYGGIAVMALALVAAVVTFAVLGRSRKRLKRRLDEEYGRMQ